MELARAPANMDKASGYIPCRACELVSAPPVLIWVYTRSLIVWEGRGVYVCVGVCVGGYVGMWVFIIGTPIRPSMNSESTLPHPVKIDEHTDT